MIRRESKFQTLFRHWLKANPMPSAAFECKQTTEDYISFSQIASHQMTALFAAKSNKGILYKGPDDSIGIKPFDLFYLRNSLAYIVIKYPQFFCLIDVDIFAKERDTISIRKSLTSSRAREIAEIVVELQK